MENKSTNTYERENKKGKMKVQNGEMKINMGIQIKDENKHMDGAGNEYKNQNRITNEHGNRSKHRKMGVT